MVFVIITDFAEMFFNHLKKGPPPPLIPLPTHGEMRPAPLGNYYFDLSELETFLNFLMQNLGRLMSPPPNNYVDDRGRYSPHRYSPDHRYDNDYSRDLYETETDFSPPPSPEPYRHHRERNNYRERNRDYSPSPPPQQQHKKRASLGKGSNNSSDKSSIISSDEWDRRTF